MINKLVALIAVNKNRLKLYFLYKQSEFVALHNMLCKDLI